MFGWATTKYGNVQKVCALACGWGTVGLDMAIAMDWYDFGCLRAMAMEG